jgi:hypothetical protein
MSKFFNQTLRSRIAVLPADGFTLTEPPDSNESDAIDSTTEHPVGDARLEQCRKMVVPIDKLLQDQFEGSHGLESAEESYRALRTRLLRLRADREMRSIVITSSIQGEGKTHTSVNLAQFCAQLHDMRARCSQAIAKPSKRSSRPITRICICSALAPPRWRPQNCLPASDGKSSSSGVTKPFNWF